MEEHDDDNIGYGASDVEDEEEEQDEELTPEQWKEKLEQMEGNIRIPFEDLKLPTEEIKTKTMLMNKKIEEEPEKMERVFIESQGRKRNHWDCESILSTYSTQYNHPTVLREPSKKKRGITKKDLNELNVSFESLVL